MPRARHGIGPARALFFVVAPAVAFGVWVGQGLGGTGAALYVDDIATAVAALAAASFCLRAALKHDGRLRLFWGLLAGACTAWLAGESAWAAYDLGSGAVPVPSWADAGYLAALPLVAAALLVHPALHGRTIGKTRSVIDGLVLAASLFFVAWAVVLEPLHRTADLASLAGSVTLAYPLGDVVIVFLVVLVVRGTTSSDRRDLWFLLAGLLLITVSDVVYSYLTDVRDFSSGSVIDTGWFAGYLALALGGLLSRSQTTERSAAAPSLTPAAMAAPFLAVLGALLLLTAKLELGRTLDRTTLTAAFTLIGLVLVRQALLVIDVVARNRDCEGCVADQLLASLGKAVSDRDAAPMRVPKGSP